MLYVTKLHNIEERRLVLFGALCLQNENGRLCATYNLTGGLHECEATNRVIYWHRKKAFVRFIEAGEKARMTAVMI